MHLTRLVASNSGKEPSMMQEPVKETGGYMASITLSSKLHLHNPSVLDEPLYLLPLEQKRFSFLNKKSSRPPKPLPESQGYIDIKN